MPNRLCKRIIPCLDVDHGRTVKGIQFQGLRDMGDPVDMALMYQEQGADELLFLDITASVEDRGTMIDVVQRVARELMIPFTVGGGVRTLEDATVLLKSGADKVSVNTAAVQRPRLMSDIAMKHGAQCCVLAIDARKKTDGSGWEVLTHGGRTPTGRNVLEWAMEGIEYGAGEILLTSWDQDGTREGFDIALNSLVAEIVSVPVIASGGASGPKSFIDVFRLGHADAALAASIFHEGEWTIGALKDAIDQEGISVRR